jgi:hypothetical protein
MIVGSGKAEKFAERLPGGRIPEPDRFVVCARD